MKKSLILAAGVVIAVGGALAAQKNIPDVSKIRGFNYQSAPTLGHAEHWLLYNPAETERDMDFARRLNLNQARVFLSYTAWMRDKVAFRKNLVHLVRACHQRGIGVMPTFQYPREFSAKENWSKNREYIADMVNTIGNGKEPGLAFWDACNEPGKARIEFAKYVAGIFRELDKVTPVTIGSTFEDEMEATGTDAVDVLCFHDYSQTRAQVRSAIERAKAYAAKVGMQVMNTEAGCIARSNPYDVVLEEMYRANMGFYLWELMITHQWGRVHGIFYPDGTVRDPTIVAAVLGFFRNRSREILPEYPDAENQVTRVVADAKKWLADQNGTWEDGIDIAEREANLLEAAQLIAMHDPPTRTVALMRGGGRGPGGMPGATPAGMPAMPARPVQRDLPGLRAVVQKWMDILVPWQLPLGDSNRTRDFGWIR